MKKLINGKLVPVDVPAPVQADPEAVPLEDRIRAAVGSLDMVIDDHWTKSGLPALAAVAGLLGRRVTRAEVNAAVPGAKRAEAAI